MGKIYEAFIRSSDHPGLTQHDEDLRVFPIAEIKPQKLSSATSVDAAHYAELSLSFLSRFSAEAIKTILFVGIEAKAGTSTIAVKFANTLAKSSKYNVLLIDSNFRSPSLHKLLNAESGYRVSGLANIATSDNQRFFQAIAIKEGLCVVPAGDEAPDPVAFFQSSDFEQFLAAARKRFDFVILDAPALRNYPEGKVLSTLVDGVVLVLQAGKTRRWLTFNTKKQIEEIGGKILGAVLNKRKFPIPTWLYKWL